MDVGSWKLDVEGALLVRAISKHFLLPEEDIILEPYPNQNYFMETTATAQPSGEEVIKSIYKHAAHLLHNENKLDVEVIDELVRMGLDHEAASMVVANVQNSIASAKKQRAHKDILFGALWCVGGIVATAANIGYIFWGAILFGGIQFIKGLANAFD